MTNTQPLNDCCTRWLDELDAIVPHEGRFTERRQCPSCKTSHRVVFEYGAVLGADLMGGAVGVE
jgi:hypothetical protein